MVQTAYGTAGEGEEDESMKVLCPVCGREGILEVRGNSQRVLHYKGMVDGKRVYEKHSVKMGVNDGSNGSKQVGINTSDLGVFGGNSHYMEPRAGFEPATPALPSERNARFFDDYRRYLERFQHVLMQRIPTALFKRLFQVCAEIPHLPNQPQSFGFENAFDRSAFACDEGAFGVGQVLGNASRFSKPNQSLRSKMVGQ